MAIPLALMAAGTALQMYGQYQANLSQARAEIINAKYYQDQADFARAAQYRQADIASRAYSARIGMQASAFAKGGVDISGSAAGMIAETAAQKVDELQAIKLKGDMEYRLAILRSRGAQTRADELTDPVNNLMQAGTILTGNFAKAYDNGYSPLLGNKTSTPSSGGDYNFGQNSSLTPRYRLGVDTTF